VLHPPITLQVYGEVQGGLGTSKHPAKQTLERIVGQRQFSSEACGRDPQNNKKEIRGEIREYGNKQEDLHCRDSLPKRTTRRSNRVGGKHVEKFGGKREVGVPDSSHVRHNCIGDGDSTADAGERETVV